MATVAVKGLIMHVT